MALSAVALSLTACEADSNHDAFRQALAEPHDLVVVRSLAEFHREPLLPLPLQLDLDPAKVALGEKLFHDKRLSRDESISCSSCHDLAAGGADSRDVAEGIDGVLGDINTPTVLNATFNFAHYWDGRAASLFEQVSGPIENPKEMDSSWPIIVDKLRRNWVYSAAFASHYPRGINKHTITDALVQFERSLLTPSAFDRYLRGDRAAISSQAKQGYALFKNYGCASCHQGINVGGNMFQKFGAVLSVNGDDTRASTEAQQAGQTLIADGDTDLFKVPSLRNAARTAPYFHNASAATLAEAIDIMGELQLGRKIPAKDNRKIQIFIESLSAEGNS